MNIKRMQEDEHLIGVIATRSEGSHIALFFVNGDLSSSRLCGYGV
ncbi:hypothetical protein lbkm_0449 [Lachnospiraceae bacterium KM106-2]|nr:hypothetical protein lbkm_0449 [Lachnospiraceae bacterium KM106-2]